MKSYQEYKNHHHQYLNEFKESGVVVSVSPPIAKVRGLPNVKFNEVVYFDSGEMGFVVAIFEDFCDVLVLSKEAVVTESKVSRSGQPFNLKLTQDFLGKSINALGEPLDSSILLGNFETTSSIDKQAPGISAREKITKSFETGVTVVDLMVPLGCGQRELVLGDRQTGKTEFFLQTLLTQSHLDTICIYANIGKKASDIRHIEDFVLNHNISSNVVLVSSMSTDPLGIVYITPYVAMTIAEFFVEKGRNVLLILDDLSTHAKFYREISLIARRFPGRNSYPGDIFYSHSRLLERGGNYKTEQGTRSLTCLIAAETIQSDISGYIQTNLMSITDGHIYFDHELFSQGRRPAINTFLSVTRVGRQTQDKIRWGINRELTSFMTLYEKTQRFIHFGAEINDGIKATLNTGSKILTLFDQPMGTIIDQSFQIIIYCLIWTGAINADKLVNLKYLGSRRQEMYQNHPEFKVLVESLLKESADLNTLLGKVSMKAKEISKYLDLEHNL